ncbi:MAG: hypothetical protein K2K57_04900 [Oscillospiraceae bacterium]|nr:hypothetical protein [Oscillospiraceae bacterium]
MGTFREVSAAACFLGIVFSIMGNMLPSEKFSGQLRVIFALVMLLVIVPRIIGADISIDFGGADVYSYEAANEAAERILNEGISRNICDSLEEILRNENIYPLEISVNVNNSPDGSISIISAQIVLGSSDSTNVKRTEQIAREALEIDEVTVQTEARE